LSDYNIIVYTEQIYRYTVLSIYINSYLNSLQYNYNKKQQKQIIQKIHKIERFILDVKKLELFEFLKLNSLAISELKVFKLNRLKY
jgi:hypothetical protein